MTNEEIRIKVAESLGWEGVRGETGYPTPRARELGDYQAVPNYPESLDCCAEFEAKMVTGDRATYREHLAQICDSDFHAETHWSTCSVHANARQRCLAYLKVKGIVQ